MLIDANAVHTTFLGCLFKEGEDTTEHVKAEGVQHRVGFHPQRLQEAAATVKGWLDALPAAFQAKQGGGWSFLQACNDRNDEQWTGLHQTMDELLTLGIATKQARILMPREMWSMFPGGVPYFSVGEE